MGQPQRDLSQEMTTTAALALLLVVAVLLLANLIGAIYVFG
jgi:hypothetical protein